MPSQHLKPLLSYIESYFPKSFETIQKRNLINPNLFSPFLLELPKSILQKVEEFVAEVYKIKDTSEYQSKASLPVDFQNWPNTKSILTCFDFHFTDENELKLIEINTNASLYLPIVLQRRAQSEEDVPPQFDKLLASFVEAFQLQPGDPISIFDEVPENEGLYFEFLIFQEWLTSKGFPTNIISLVSFSNESHKNIYNRYTDFYFSNDQSKFLEAAYKKGEKVFSPNPREYSLLADKRRMQVLRGFLNDPQLAKIIPETKLFSEFSSKEEIWDQRKKFFFKPSKGYGSKGAFAGKGISHKAFETLYSPDFIAQEFCPAGKRLFKRDGEDIEMKFDLRFFTFEGQIQNYGARIYQGQTTNMRTRWGGLTPIKFI